MQINDTVNKNGLMQVAESICGLGDGGITSEATLLKQMVNYANIAVAEVRSELLMVDKSWKADDYNYTNIADAPISFVASQFDYQLPVSATGENPATLLRVNHVYYVSGSERVYLPPMDRREQYNASATGTPSAYYFDGKSIFFDTAPDAAFIATIPTFHVDFSRMDDAFVSGDTTQQPGFLGTYHHILAYKMASLYFSFKDLQRSRYFSSGDKNAPGLFENGLKSLVASAVRMNGDKRQVMTPHLTPYL